MDEVKEIVEIEALRIRCLLAPGQTPVWTWNCYCGQSYSSVTFFSVVTSLMDHLPNQINLADHYPAPLDYKA